MANPNPNHSNSYGQNLVLDIDKRPDIDYTFLMPNKRTKIYYYLSSRGNNPVRDFLDSLSIKQQVKALRIFQHLQEFGATAAIPHLKKLAGTPLWEIRILGKDNIRFLYFIPRQNYILILHGFIKKKQKAPRKEIATALKRLADWEARSS